MGHDVHVACRTEAKAKAAAETSGAAGAFVCDLSSLQSVRGFADAWGGKPIDTLCLNAGERVVGGGEPRGGGGGGEPIHVRKAMEYTHST